MDPPPPWRKCFSKTHKSYYYFNTVDGTSSWNLPTITSQDTPAVSKSDRKRSGDESSDADQSKRTKLVLTINPPKPTELLKLKVAIIVPFRDLHKEQNRRQHLNQFVPRMMEFMSITSVNFILLIVQQSNDNRKFNRGKLLNIGFDLACKAGYSVMIFHDVDLLPLSHQLLEAYSTAPSEKQPVHIARVWKDRYSTNDNYFGGIVKFSAKQFVAINGFPNNFWGWGGEDDEMLKRVHKVGSVYAYPLFNSFSSGDRSPSRPSRPRWAMCKRR